MYQQHYLEVFQDYIKKGTNEFHMSAGQKNAELFFEKQHLICKLKFANSLAVILYFSFHNLSYFRVIHNL